MVFDEDKFYEEWLSDNGFADGVQWDELAYYSQREFLVAESMEKQRLRLLPKLTLIKGEGNGETTNKL